MKPLTDDEIRLIHCLEPQVTQGPWKHQRIGHRIVTVEDCEADCVCVAPSEIHFPCSAEYWESNAQFIVQARNLLPRAIAEIERLRAELADVSEERDRLRASLHEASGIAVALGNDRDKLRDRLADYEAAVGNIMAEPCDAAESHCTCVPALRIEVDRLREWKESAMSVMDALQAAWERCGKPGKLGERMSDSMADEVIRLRAELVDANEDKISLEQLLTARDEELLNHPPTLEWLRDTFGKPNDFDGLSWLWLSSSGDDAVRYFIPSKRVEILTQTADMGRVWYAAKDRAAVLEAVAATKIESEAK